MKKIRSKKQLQAEKKRMKLRQEELEKKIRSKWNEVKDSLKPMNFAKESFSKIMQDKAEENLKDESVLKSTIRYGVSLLAKKFTDKAGEKFDWMFRKNGK
jgi:uncharacterized protein YllA (UPF0747 family)